MLFLWCFSSPICKKIHGRSRSTMHKWSRRRQNRAKTLSCLWQLRVKCNWVRRPSYYLKLCEVYGYEYLRSITTPLEEWQNNSVLYGGRRASRYWGFLSTGSTSSTSSTSPTSLSQVYEILQCVQQQYEVRVWVSEKAQGNLLPPIKNFKKKKMKIDQREAQGDRYLDCQMVTRVHTWPSCVPVRKEVPRKRSIHVYLLKDRNCEMQENQNTWNLCQTRTSEALPRAENYRDLRTEEHRVLTETCESRVSTETGKAKVLTQTYETRVLSQTSESRNNHWHALAE